MEMKSQIIEMTRSNRVLNGALILIGIRSALVERPSRISSLGALVQKIVSWETKSSIIPEIGGQFVDHWCCWRQTNSTICSTMTKNYLTFLTDNTSRDSVHTRKCRFLILIKYFFAFEVFCKSITSYLYLTSLNEVISQ